MNKDDYNLNIEVLTEEDVTGNEIANKENIMDPCELANLSKEDMMRKIESLSKKLTEETRLRKQLQRENALILEQQIKIEEQEKQLTTVQQELETVKKDLDNEKKA